jgi:hypothetical protein
MDVKKIEMGLSKAEIRSMKKDGFTTHQIRVKEQMFEYRAFENFAAYMAWNKAGRPYNEKFEQNMRFQNDKLKKVV